MQGATHFIEVYKNKGKELTGVLSDLKYLDRNLKITQQSTSLKTIAVWRIRLKPGVKIPTYDTN